MIFGSKAVKPLHDFILIRRLPNPNTTPSGLYIGAAECENNLVEVVAVGPGRENIPGSVPTVKPGDKILMERFVGMKVSIEGVEHVMVKWYDCQAVVDF
jgi:chaperonin GroES